MKSQIPNVEAGKRKLIYSKCTIGKWQKTLEIRGINNRKMKGEKYFLTILRKTV